MQKQRKIEQGDTVLWYGLVCTVSSVTDDELSLAVNGRTYYDYAWNVEKLEQ